jgi:hypothetical protein
MSHAEDVDESHKPSGSKMWIALAVVWFADFLGKNRTPVDTADRCRLCHVPFGLSFFAVCTSRA